MTIRCKDVAEELNSTHATIKTAIKNGSLPIGFVVTRKGSSIERVVICKERYEAWKNGRDLTNDNKAI